MPSGAKPGERRGGRQKGTPNKPKETPKYSKKQEIIQQALAEGVTPLDIMMDNARFYHAKYERLLREATEACPEEMLPILKTMVDARTAAQGCARDAAPYIHAKLSNIEQRTKITKTADELTDEELIAIAGDAGGEERDGEEEEST